MAYKPKGVLEERAEIFGRMELESIQRGYPVDFGVFFETTQNPRFMPVVPGLLLTAWVCKNARDPRKDFPWPQDLYNAYTWAKTQAAQNGIAAVPHQPNGAVEAACTELGYQGYRVYGTSLAERHLANSLRSRGASRAGGAVSIGDLLKDTLQDLGLR